MRKSREGEKKLARMRKKRERSIRIRIKEEKEEDGKKWMDKK